MLESLFLLSPCMPVPFLEEESFSAVTAPEPAAGCFFPPRGSSFDFLVVLLEMWERVFSFVRLAASATPGEEPYV